MNSVSFEGRAVVPSKVVCIGRNYVEHIAELNNETPSEPVIFMKPNSAISEQLRAGAGDDFHYESELSFLIQDGQAAAVAFGLDITNRAVQATLKAKGLPWERAKAFDGSAVFSDFVTVEKDLSYLSLTTHINGELVQQGGVELMMLKPDDILAEVSSLFTLEDGDIVMTGTPAGVGPYCAGDHFRGCVYSGAQLLVVGEWVAV